MAPVQRTNTNPNPQWIAAAGRGGNDPQNAQAFQQSMAGQESPPSVGGVEFPNPRNRPEAMPIRQENAQFVHNLYASSPTFYNAVNTATDNGRDPIHVRYGRTEGSGVGSWNPNNRMVRVDYRHPEADMGRVQGSTSFELINATSARSHARLNNDARNGVHEQRAAAINAQNPGRRPVTGGELYGKAVERLEWENARTHHQAMTESATAGMPTHPSSDRFGSGFGTSRNPGPWRSFDNYYNDQVQTGHTQRRLCGT